MGAPICKAGKSRHLGKRPHVRGSAKNACDHAHGGGEGRWHAKLPEVLECQMADGCIMLHFFMTLRRLGFRIVMQMGGRKRSEGSQFNFQFFSLMSQVAHWSRPPQDEVGQALTSELYIGNVKKNESHQRGARWFKQFISFGISSKMLKFVSSADDCRWYSRTCQWVFLFSSFVRSKRCAHGMRTRRSSRSDKYHAQLKMRPDKFRSIWYQATE